MTRDEMLELFDYDRWATERQLEAAAQLQEEAYVRNLVSSHGGVRGTLVHMYAAQLIWFSRWKGESPTSLAPESELPTLGMLRERWSALQADIRRFAADLNDENLKATVSYKDTAGNPHSQPLATLIRHVINHSTYHRGQITTMLRQLGAVPPSSVDLITYCRQARR